MLPNSHAWKMLCKLYGLLLKQEWARRLAENGALPVFMGSALKVREIWQRMLAGPAMMDECVLARTPQPEMPVLHQKFNPVLFRCDRIVVRNLDELQSLDGKFESARSARLGTCDTGDD